MWCFPNISISIRAGRFCRASTTLALLLLLLNGACGPDTGDVIGEAYIAPASVNLRRELAQKNSTAALLKHGEPVQIIDVRRRFVRVRAANGVVGWMDSAQLLSPEQWEQIRLETQQALAMPSEGSATVFEALNVHLDPSRQSPAFAKIPESGSVETLAHRVEPKTTGPARPGLSFEKPSSSRRQRKEKQAKNAARLPPRPPPPKPPANWQDLSAERIDGAQSTADIKAEKDRAAIAKKVEQEKKPVILEDWTLVRTKDKQVGWVLSRNLSLSIPDEVAQYAEGKRITSYFSLGSVKDEEKGVKNNWLWTTSSSVQACDFDAWRVFLWNRRRHRYETSYRLSGLQGYFPVHVDPPGESDFERTFEIVTKDDDGKFRRRTYAFDGTRVHGVRTEEYTPGSSSGESKPGLDMQKLQARAPQPGFFRREWMALKRRIFGSS